MVNTSVVFDSEIDERSLDRTVDKVDSRLQETGQIDIDAATGGMGLNAGPGTGGGMGDMDALGEMEGQLGGLQDSFDNSLPGAIPAAGGIASKALPIAIAGGIGAGLLTQMSAASGRLQATLGMFGTAMDLFFRPFGDFLGKNLRPMAEDLIDFADEFNRIAEEDGLGVAIVSMGSDVISEIANQIGESAVNLATGEWDAKDLITITAAVWGAKSIISLAAGTWGAKGLLSLTAGTWGAGSLLAIGSKLPVAAGGLITIAATTWAANELIKIGKGIPVENVFTRAGDEAAVKGENNPLRNPDLPFFDPDPETGVIDPRNVPGLKQAYEAGQNFRPFGIDFAEQVFGIPEDDGPGMIERRSQQPQGRQNIPELDQGLQSEVGDQGRVQVSEDLAKSTDIDNLALKLERMIEEIQGQELVGKVVIGEEQFAEIVQQSQENTQTGVDPLQSP